MKCINYSLVNRISLHLPGQFEYFESKISLVIHAWVHFINWGDLKLLQSSIRKLRQICSVIHYGQVAAPAGGGLND